MTYLPRWLVTVGDGTVAIDPMRISESDLVLPALEALSKYRKTGLTTSELIPILRGILRPSGKDTDISPHRGDDYFSEKVRNLRSHRTLEKMGVAKFDGERYRILPAGKKFLSSAKGAWKSYSRQGFPSNSVNRNVTPVKPYVFVEEGQERSVKSAARRRSRKLRDYAVKRYGNGDGTINCKGCGFEGKSTFGPMGVGLIEIHHIKPISTAGQSKKDIRSAVSDVVPLCPTCHRMVHRDPRNVMPISTLKALVKR